MPPAPRLLTLPGLLRMPPRLLLLLLLHLALRTEVAITVAITEVAITVAITEAAITITEVAITEVAIGAVKVVAVVEGAATPIRRWNSE